MESVFRAQVDTVDLSQEPMFRYVPSGTVNAGLNWYATQDRKSSPIARIMGAGDLLCHLVRVEAMLQGLIVSDDQVDAWVGETLTDIIANQN